MTQKHSCGDTLIHCCDTFYVPHVVLSTVETTISKEAEDQYRKICEELGVTYRIRAWEE